MSHAPLPNQTVIHSAVLSAAARRIGRGAIAAAALFSALVTTAYPVQAQSLARLPEQPAEPAEPASERASERYHAGAGVSPTLMQRNQPSDADTLESEASLPSPTDQTRRVRLGVDGETQEWIRIEQNATPEGVQIIAYHTSRVKKRLLSNVATGLTRFGAGEVIDEIVDGYDGPVIVPRVEFHGWADHETRSIVFIPEGCADNPFTLLGTAAETAPSSCAIVGSSSILLPPETDMQAGLFTLEYAEQDLIRTVTFQVP